MEQSLKNGLFEKTKQLATALRQKNKGEWNWKVGYLLAELNREGKYAQALELVRGVDLKDVDPRFLCCVTWALDEMGKTDEALAALQAYPDAKKDDTCHRKEQMYFEKIAGRL